MQYNPGDSTGCVDEILKICGATTAVYPLEDITRRFNGALDWYKHLASKAGKKWEFDDPNYPTPPIVTQTITSGVNKYKLTGFSGSANSNLFFNKLTVTNSQGIESEIGSEDFLEVDFVTNYDTTNQGQPLTYTKLGDYIYIRPTPNYTGTLSGYTVRTPYYMLVGDTTRVPGVPLIHHFALCRQASLPYLIENRLPNKNDIASLLAKDEKEILEYFGYRNVDSRASGMREDNR